MDGKEVDKSPKLVLYVVYKFAEMLTAMLQ